VRKTCQIRLTKSSERSSAQQLSVQLPIRSSSLFSSLPPPLPMNNPSPRSHSNRRKKRDESQTNSPLPSTLPASGSANPSIPALLNAADRLPSASPIRRARRGGNEYGSSRPNPSTSATELPLEDRPLPAFPIHELPSIRRVRGSVQDGSQSPGAVAPYNSGRHSPSVAQITTALQGMNLSATPYSNPVNPGAFPPPDCRSAPYNPIYQPPSAAPTIARLQGTTEDVLRPSLVNTSDLSRTFSWSTTVWVS
jgi:hypothetical protein